MQFSRPPATRASSNATRKWRVTLLVGLLLAGMNLSLYSAASLAATAANRQQAIDMALRQNGGDGKVLGVQSVKDKNGQTIFAVKILSNGRVRVFRIKQGE